ncbi:TetR family transcriptional regulator [Actinomadura sp. DC4]|uniref:TetR family transcriptional regulator n=1 Tax=Actinomadura sp. DC4 TaxID=3055069 RepID=UPI0025B00810|nr:TetR family transcriptional regulator [Actinomadura sp. DC4]MDN3357583.1 TetR family transcriptional regulator [Actinomadura sp. DC4]
MAEGRGSPRSVPGRAAGRGRGPGRPPRIDRAAIARAAGEIPLEELTLRSVAERLGVSVPGLYHYVSGRDDLLRLAAEQSALRMTLPTDRGQHWAVWFYEWADYIHRAFVGDAEFLKQYIDGAVGVDVQAGHVDAALGLCVRQGFSEREALEAYDLVSECALGAAISEIRDRRAWEDDRPIDVEIRRLVARRGAELPRLSRLVEQSVSFRPPSFAGRIHTVLAGIAVRRGDSWTEIAELLRTATGHEDPG